MFPPRPSWAAMRVLKASTVLTPLEKLVALEIFGLDNRDKAGSACFATADTLAERLGTHVETVEGIRRNLKAYGLLDCMRRFQRADWAITLPPGCSPPTERVSPDDLIRFRERLDAHLAGFIKINGHVHVKPGSNAGSVTRRECRESPSAKPGTSAAPKPAPMPPHTRHQRRPLNEVGVEVGEKDGTPPSTLPGEDGVKEKTQTDKTATPGQTLDGLSTPSDAEKWTELRADLGRKLQDSDAGNASQGGQ